MQTPMELLAELTTTRTALEELYHDVTGRWPLPNVTARAEGFDSREAFWGKLRALYGVDVDLDALYWALTFELVKGD